MNIRYVSSASGSTIDIPVNQLVNKIGKYLNRTIDGAYSFKIRMGECDVYVEIYYQIPQLPEHPGDPITYSELMTMSVNINLTAYSNKIRVNIIEISPEEQTIGHFVLSAEKVRDMLVARKIIKEKIIKLLNKTFEGYQFIF